MLAECSRAENINELKYIRYLLLSQSENPRSKEAGTGSDVVAECKKQNRFEYQAKNNNSQYYRKDDKMNFINEIAEIKSTIQIFCKKC